MTAANEAVNGFVAVVAAEDPSQTHHWLWPEGYELLFGVPATLLVFGLLYWKAWPVIKQGMAARTQRIQDELDEATKARSDAEAEAARIREALGDIETERSRILADADVQAEATLVDGRQRLDAETAEMESKAASDLEAAASRSGDELRSEIVRLSSAAIDRVVVGSVDDTAHQDLIEAYIAKVGAGAGVRNDV